MVMNATMVALAVAGDPSNRKAAKGDADGQMYVNPGPSIVVDYTGVVGGPAYSAGDCMGGLASIALPTGFWKGYLESLAVLDKASQSKDFQLIFFKERPAGTFTDNAALNISDADADLICGFMSVGTADYASLGSNATMAMKTGLNVPIHANTSSAPGTTVYFTLRTTGTPTYGVSNELILRMGIWMHPAASFQFAGSGA
jgi:hypothetical protein